MPVVEPARDHFRAAVVAELLVSSLLDVPAQLALVLYLAAATVAGEPAAPAAIAEPTAATAPLVPQPLAGPLRFSEAMWLRALKDCSKGSDAEDYAAAIFQTSGGRYYVPAEGERARILAARENVELAGRMAHAFALSNARHLTVALQRAPTPGDLYLAHVFGAEAAAAFIDLVVAKPRANAAEHLPELAQSAPALVSVGRTPLTLAQLYIRLTAALRRQPPEFAALAGGGTTARLALKPTVVDAPSTPTGTESERWQAEVSAADPAVQ
jgi:hypothetical protein